MTIGFSDIFSQVSAISLHTERYPARLALDAKLLGLNPTPELQRVMRLGSVSLLPDRAFEGANAAASAAREFLRENSVRMAMLPSTRLVKNDKLEYVLLQLGMYRDVFNTAVAKTFAEESYAALRAEQEPVIRSAFRTALKLDENPSPLGESLLTQVMAVVASSYLSSASAIGRFSLYWTSPFSLERGKARTGANDVESELNDVKGILRGITEELREDLTSKLADIRALVGRGGKITKKTTNSARDLISRIQDLYIVGDPIFDKQIDEVHKWLNRLDADTKGTIDGGFVDALSVLETAIKEDVDMAVARAESALTSMGRRRLILEVESAPAEVATPEVVA